MLDLDHKLDLIIAHSFLFTQEEEQSSAMADGDSMASLNYCMALFDYLALRAQQILFRIERYLRLKENWQTGKQLAAEHPLLTVMIMTALALCSLPVACFVTFAVGSIMVTFFGFIVLEGFLLLVGGAFLVLILGSIGFVIVIGVSVLLLTFFAFTGGQQMIINVVERVKRYLSRTSQDVVSN